LDEEVIQKAMEQAKKNLAEVKDEKQRIEAGSILRRSIIDMKLVKRRRSRTI